MLADGESCSAALERLLDMTDRRFRVAGLTSFYEYAFGWLPLDRLTPMWFLSLLHLRQRPGRRPSKRVFDVVFATAGLVLTGLLLPVIVLLVKQTPGPLLYRQTRVGERGRRFTMYKFRTMPADAERPGEPVFAQAHDPRASAGGRFLRRTHLDELPQLWNVLKGEMSIVGPRPERPEFVEMLETTIPFWSRRLLMKPGMTGWAQVRCGYASDCAERRREALLRLLVHAPRLAGRRSRGVHRDGAASARAPRPAPAEDPPPASGGRDAERFRVAAVAAFCVSLVREFEHPDGILSPTQGSVQQLDGGGAFIGWGRRAPVLHRVRPGRPYRLRSPLPREGR